MGFIKNSLLFFVALLVLSACASRKRLLYFNDIDTINKVDSFSRLIPITIQTGDILQVTISTIDRDVANIFNPVSSPGSGAQGYLVDHDGNIELPMVGKVYVRNKTTEVINADIKVILEKSLKNIFVSTRLLNFKISVLGDVARPGNYNITNERVSILEALSMAGDISLAAKRDDVLLIREREGKKSYVSLNLNRSEILSSPYYYLSNNDVIYVRPGVNRVIANTTAIQLFPVIASAITLILVIYNNTLRN